MAEEDDIKTYRGNCHCGDFVYELTTPEITFISPCHCSICSKKAYMWTMLPDPDNLKLVKGNEADLSSYTFGPKSRSHKVRQPAIDIDTLPLTPQFCPTCGSAILARDSSAPREEIMLVNTRCLQNFNVWDTPTELYPGLSVGEHFEPAPFHGDGPKAEVDNAKEYHGSCHCGAVTVAAKFTSLDQYSERIAECNCSICMRNGYIWIYLKPDQLVVNGEENLTQYLMGNRMMGKRFCKTCGVQIMNHPVELSQEAIQALPEGVKNWYSSGLGIRPLNLRVLDGVDLSGLKIDRFDGSGMIEPKYVNP